MKISSRVHIHLICGGENYVRDGRKDHRASLPTIMNEIKKAFEMLYYCGDEPRPELCFYARSFVSSLKVIPCDENPEPKQELEQLGVSKQEAAKMLGLSESTVHHLTQSGELPCKRVGRRVIYSVDSLREFLKKE